MKKLLQKVSIILNRSIFKKDVPLCYTAYERKGLLYKVINLLFFWQNNHCRRTYLKWRIGMAKKIGKFPKKPKLVVLPKDKSAYSCDCNYCRLGRYCTKVNDEAALLAYLVAEERMLNHFIEILKKEGWTDKGFNSSNPQEEKNLAYYLVDLDDTRCLIGSIINDKSTKLILKDSEGLDTI